MTTYTSLLKKTGQTTSYVTGDDGDLEIGAALSYTDLTTGQYSGTTTITLNSVDDVHSNNCFLDNTTGLMWLADYAGLVGVDFGKGNSQYFPWTTDVNNIGIWTYLAAANSASLAGHNDWRIPNAREANSIMDYSTDLNYPSKNGFWTSTTRNSDTAKAYVSTSLPQASTFSKTDSFNYILLVRGSPTAPAAGGGSLIHGTVD